MAKKNKKTEQNIEEKYDNVVYCTGCTEKCDKYKQYLTAIINGNLNNKIICIKKI